MKKKKHMTHMTFGMKMILLAVVMSVALAIAALISGFIVFVLWTGRSYAETANTLTGTLRSQVKIEELDRYFALVDLDNPGAVKNGPDGDTLDARYREIEDYVIELESDSDASDVYIVRAAEGVGLVILFDSAADVEFVHEGGDPPLGSTYMSDAVARIFDQMLLGGEIGEGILDEQDYTLTFLFPFYRENGIPSGYYVMVDFPLSDILRSLGNYILSIMITLGILTVIFVGIYTLVVHFRFVRPLDRLTRAAQSCAEGAGPEAFENLRLKGSYELQSLADRFHAILVEKQNYNEKQRALALARQKIDDEMSLTGELNMSMFPRRMPLREEDYPFRVQGVVQQGRELCSCFYDYFPLEQDRLCVMVGETPGSGMPQMLFTAVAQAAVKSRLMSGLSLMETMTSANRQMYDMGRELYLNVLVGVLDGATGSFTCVNAGQRPPLLLRGQERYDWVDAFSYAPLGQNENVLYRVLELKLNQGDRLFFHTEGLREIRDRDGRRFADESLRMTLNEKPVRTAGLERQLKLISDAAAACAVSGEPSAGYALLALEYSRKDRAKAFCVLTPDSAGGRELQIFLREQLRTNDIEGRQMAQIMVLGDELFTLCCQRNETGGKLLAECAIQDGLVQLSVKGDMGGQDPLEPPGEGPARRSVEFISQNCDRVFFERDQSMDIVTLMKRIPETPGKAP